MIIKKKGIPAVLFFILAEIMYSFDLTYITLPKSIYSFLLFGVFLMFFLVVMVDTWTIKEVVRASFLLLMALLVYFSSTESLFLTLIFSGIVMKNISYDEAAKVIFSTRLVMTFIVIGSSFIGILPLNKLYISKGLFGYQVGYGLGYQHPNNLAQSIFLLCCLYICMKKEKLRSSDIFIVSAIDCLLYLVTKSKTTCIVLLLMCLILLFKNNNTVARVIKKVSLPYIFFISSLSVVIPMLYTYSSGTVQNLIFTLNGILNGRFSNASMLFKSFPVTLFGKIVDTNYLDLKYGYDVVDNGYAFLLFNYGIFGFLLVIFLYLYAVNKFIKKDVLVYVVVIVGFLSIAMMENVIRAMFMNFTVIFWYEFIAPRNKSLET